MDQQAVLSELTKSKERLEVAMALTRTPREVRTNYDSRTSNSLPRGQYQPNENNHGSVVNAVDSDTIPKRSNQNFDYFESHSNIEKGPRDVSELGPNHGTPVNAWSQTLDMDYFLKVIPLSEQ